MRKPPIKGTKADRWLTFVEAGRLIDGPAGWQLDEEKGGRPQARALLHLASTGKVRMTAKDWTFSIRKEDNRPPTEEEKFRFASLLLAREKQQKNKLEKSQIGGVITQEVFRVANEKFGHFDLFQISLAQGGGELRTLRHLVYGLKFSRRDIEEWFDLKPNPLSDDGNVDEPNRGRKAAGWWPSFAEELAFYIHEVGIPAGEGADGQSKMISEVFERLAKRGCPEPSRTSVQPVISNLLKRLRSAEK